MRIEEEVNIKTWILEPYKYNTIPLIILIIDLPKEINKCPLLFILY